jgi:hypothetical protein
MLNKHSMKIGKYEFKTCDKYLTQDGELIKAIIVSKGCVICIYNQHPKDLDWSVEEVCNRMVEALDDKDFREVFKYGHNYLSKDVKDEALNEEQLDKLIKLEENIRDFLDDFSIYENREIKSVCFDLWEIVNKISRIYMDNIKVSDENP